MASNDLSKKNVLEIVRGPTCTTVPMEREVKTYTLFESELKAISLFNTLTTVCFAVTSGLVSFAIGIRIDLALEPEPTPEAKTMISVLCLVFVSLAVISAAIGGLAWKRRRDEFERVGHKTKVTS